MPEYRFEEIAINSTEKKKPVEADKDTYLGLEHLDSGSLRVMRWGAEVAPIGDKLVMYKGDVLFGRRRAYQKKVAIAPFDGIFSAHGMVLRPRTEVISERLFPFFIASDYFLDAAIKISVGSLSPTINWRDLKDLKFNIPPLAQQDELAEEMWAFEETKEAYSRLMAATDALVKSQFIEMFGDPTENPFHWPMKSLLDMGYFKNGMNFRTGDCGVELRCLGVGDFKDHSAIYGTDDLPIISLNEQPPKEYMLNNGDIVFVRSNGNKALVGRCLVVYPYETPTTYSGFCIRYRMTSREANMQYLLHVLKTESMRKKLFGRGANIQNLNQQTLASLIIPIPSIKQQEKFVTFVESTDKSKFALQQNIERLEMCRNALMQKAFG